MKQLTFLQMECVLSRSPFFVAGNENYEVKVKKRVWITQMAEGMTKRFCALHLAFRAEERNQSPQEFSEVKAKDHLS